MTTRRVKNKKKRIIDEVEVKERDGPWVGIMAILWSLGLAIASTASAMLENGYIFGGYFTGLIVVTVAIPIIKRLKDRKEKDEEDYDEDDRENS